MRKTDFCKHVGKVLTVNWKKRTTGDGERVTMRHCPEAGKKGCPVNGIPGHMNFRDCPLIPQSVFYSHG